MQNKITIYKRYADIITENIVISKGYYVVLELKQPLLSSD